MRTPTIVTHGRHGALSYDEDVTRGDLYDEETGVGVEDREWVTTGTDLVTTANGAVATGGTVSRGVSGGAPVPDARAREAMTEEDILAVIDAELANCSAQYSGELAENRIAALRYYEGRMQPPLKGRSAAVSTDVADVVEWTLPQVVKALCSGGAVEFVATSEEDEQQAQLEQDACHHVINTENSGFLYYYSCVKDALLQKNGVGKVFQDESVRVTVEEYEGLTEAEVGMLLEPGDGSIVRPMEYADYVRDVGGVPVQLFDITVNRYQENGRTCVDSIPPEEFLVNRDHQSIDLTEARFTAHKRLVTESELIAEGWPEDLVGDLPTYSVDETGEREERRSLEDEKDFGYDASDRAVRRIQVIECYARIDRDRDGVAELLQVHVAGSGAYYLMGWEHVDSNPFVGCTPFLLSHKFYGRSIYDKCKEIQDQKTFVVRNLQDNLAHQNNSRLLVVAGQVNLDDLFTSRPGGVVRQKAPGMVEPLVSPQIGELGYKHLEYLDNVRTGRVGVSPDTASMAEAIAGDTAHGLERLMSAKEELVGLMIELFAVTLATGTVTKVRKLLQQYRKTPMHFKARGKWQTVNPAEWQSRTGVRVPPGLSHGDRMKRAQALALVGEQQARAYADPTLRDVLVTSKNIFHTATEFIRATNIDDPSPFWQDPESPEAQQVLQQRQAQQQQAQQQQVAMGQMTVQAQLMVEREKELTKRMQMQADQTEAQQKLLLEYQKLVDTMKQKYTELELEYSTDVPGEGMEGGGNGARVQ